jgi:hypothetical protein
MMRVVPARWACPAFLRDRRRCTLGDSAQAEGAIWRCTAVVRGSILRASQDALKQPGGGSLRQNQLVPMAELLQKGLLSESLRDLGVSGDAPQVAHDRLVLVLM